MTFGKATGTKCWINKNQTNQTNQQILNRMKLNNLLKTLGFLALAINASAGTGGGKAPAPVAPCCTPEETLGVDLSVGYDSSLIFRGVDLADNRVSTDLNLVVPLVDTVSLHAGASYGVSADDRGADTGGISYQRLELNAGLSFDLGAADLGVGYRFYQHEGDLSAILDDTNEVGITLATTAGPVNLGVGTYYDITGEGWYFEVAANTEVKINDSISLVPGVSIGYGVDYTWQISGANVGDGFTAVGLSLAMPIKLTKSATLTPYVAGNLPIDALDDAGEESQVYGGVSLSVKF